MNETAFETPIPLTLAKIGYFLPQGALRLRKVRNVIYGWPSTWVCL
jgi:hypothetical protein